MPTATVTTKFYEFQQNNSGGTWQIDDAVGIGPRVWIEATDLDHACARASKLGIYFEGVAAGMDCGCCGDRWYRPWADEGADEVAPNERYDFLWHPTVYVHHLNGEIIRIAKADGEPS